MRYARPLAALLALSLSPLLPQTAGAAPGVAPNRFVGISADRHAVIAQGPGRATGPVAAIQDGIILDADLSPNGRWVYYSTRSRVGDRIYLTSFEDGPSQLVVEGGAFALSPDGEYLAYSHDPDRSGSDGTDEFIGLIDLDDGMEEWVYAGPFPSVDGPSVGIEDLAFSPDGGELAFATTEGVVWTFDLTHGRLDTASPLLTAAGGMPVSDPVWMADGRIAVLDHHGNAVRALHPRTGEGTTLVTVPGLAADGLDGDGSGHHLLLSVPEFTGDSRGFVVVPWADRENPRPGGGQECDWAFAAW